MYHKKPYDSSILARDAVFWHELTINIETLIILADYFGVNIEYLLGRSAKFKDNLSTLTEYYYEDITYLDLIATIKQFNKHDKALLYEIIKLIKNKTEN